MKDIEDKLKDKYDKVEVPDYMFDTSRVFKRIEEEKKDNKKKIVSIAASIIVILLIVVALIFTMPKILKEDIIINEKGTIEKIKGEVIINSSINNYEKKATYTLMVLKIEKIIDYQIINNIPYTKVKAQILNSYIGDLSGEIEIYVPGGIFSIKDIKDNVKYYNVDDISKFKDDDLVKVTYYDEIYIPVAEEGKSYIATLIKDGDNYFVDIDKPYGFKEYDSNTNTIKTKEGTDEIFELEKYLENIK